MACDFTIPAGMTPASRKSQVAQAVDKLNAALQAGTVTVKIGATGAVVFVGTWQRDGVSDVCAYRKLIVAGSPALRMAVAKAEAMAGRKVDARTVASGTHSHDGGASWHKGH
jgi:hypothetical protein